MGAGSGVGPGALPSGLDEEASGVMSVPAGTMVGPLGLAGAAEVGMVVVMGSVWASPGVEDAGADTVEAACVPGRPDPQNPCCQPTTPVPTTATIPVTSPALIT